MDHLVGKKEALIREIRWIEFKRLELQRYDLLKIITYLID